MKIIRMMKNGNYYLQMVQIMKIKEIMQLQIKEEKLIRKHGFHIVFQYYRKSNGNKGGN